MCCQVRHVKSCGDWFPFRQIMCHSRHVATRKPDSEVGPLGVWAYDTARLLGLTPEQVAVRAGVTEPTIRKIEGGSNRNPSRRVVYEMARYFREVAAIQGVAIADPPGAYMAGTGGGDTLSVPADLYTRMDNLYELVERLVKQNAELMARLLPAPSAIEERAAAALADLESAEEREPTQNTSPHRRSDRGRRSGVGSLGRRADGLA